MLVFGFSSNTIADMIARLPRKAIRYRNAGIATVFICSMIAAADYITSAQLKSTGYYKFSLRTVRTDKRVTDLVGIPLQEPWRVSHAKHRRNFEMNYRISGPKGSATVRFASVIDPLRESISAAAYRFIKVEVDGIPEPIVLVENELVPVTATPVNRVTVSHKGAGPSKSERVF